MSAWLETVCRRRALASLAVLCCAVFILGDAPSAAQKSRVAVVLTIKDAIGPATSDFFLRALETAHKRDAAILVLELDTPGGLDAAIWEWPAWDWK